MYLTILYFTHRPRVVCYGSFVMMWDPWRFLLLCSVSYLPTRSEFSIHNYLISRLHYELDTNIPFHSSAFVCSLGQDGRLTTVRQSRAAAGSLGRSKRSNLASIHPSIRPEFTERMMLKQSKASVQYGGHDYLTSKIALFVPIRKRGPMWPACYNSFTGGADHWIHVCLLVGFLEHFFYCFGYPYLFTSFVDVPARPVQTGSIPFLWLSILLMQNKVPIVPLLHVTKYII